MIKNLEEYLKNGHTRACTIHRFSDQENRKCSCGHEKAVEALRELSIVLFIEEMKKDEEQY